VQQRYSISVRSLSSRRAAGCARAAMGVLSALPWPALVQTLYATHCECGCCACHACGSIGHVCTGGLRCMQAPVPIMLCHALLIENVRLGVASTH